MSSWRNIARRVAHWTIPPGVAGLLQGRIAPRLAKEEKAILARNRELRNRHVGQRCFILATGPSIQRQDLKLLAGEHCIAVSNFFVHPDYATIKPAYHCIAPYHPPITEEAWQDWMTEMDEHLGAATLFLFLQDKGRWEVGAGGNARQRKVHFLHYTPSWSAMMKRGVDLTAPIPVVQSVPIMALLVAIYMGFNKIYLLGCDHDWICHLGESRHFYDESNHALNRQGYNEWFGPDVESYCRSYVSLWQQYKAVTKLAEVRGAKVFNATAGGILDVFPRTELGKLFSERPDNQGGH